MATIDELIVRLDADLKPLETKLKRAERLLKDFSKMAERQLIKPPSAVATFIDPRPTKLPATKAARERVAANAGDRTTVPTQEVVLGALPAAKILLDIAVSVGSGVASGLILDTFLSEEFKPEEELFKGDFDPNRIQQAFFEFEARSDDLAKAAEEAAVAEDRIVKELGSVRSQEIATKIQERLQDELNAVGKDLTEEIKALFTGEETSRKLREALDRALEERQARGLKGGLTGAETARTILETARNLKLITDQAAEEISKRFHSIARALEAIEGGIPDPETQARIARAREAAEPVQRLELEIPEGLGNACDCIRELLDRLPMPRFDEPEIKPQTASLSGGVGGASLGFAPAVEDQAAAWQAVLDRVLAMPPALAATRRETLDVDRAVRNLGFTFASAFEDAIVKGESLSDILQGLEEDILRILTRLLITEPLARGLTAGLGSFTGGGLGQGGGLEGLIGGGFGALANLFPSPVAGVGLGTFNALAPIAAQDVANPLLAGVFQSGGPVHGTVHGPGGPTGDRIPALLSDGEFVVNAKATRLNRQLLEAVNSNRLRRHLEEGGQIGMTLPEISPIRQGPAPTPAREPSFAGRPVVVHIHNPTSVPEIQRGMAQIRGSLREMLARAERRGE